MNDREDKLKQARLQVNKRKMAERNAQVVELRNEGKTFQEIADKLGVSRQRVHVIFQKTVNELQPQVSESQ
jgi:DNA-directed RNA polymerase specialized sigma subunit